MVHHLAHVLFYQSCRLDDCVQIQRHRRSRRSLRHLFLDYLTAGVAVVAVGAFLSALVRELL